jgi:hypothetical protein
MPGENLVVIRPFFALKLSSKLSIARGIFNIYHTSVVRSRDSAVGIATDYGLDDGEIESR